MKDDLLKIAKGFINLKLDIEDKLALVTINRPDIRNSLSGQTLGEIEALFSQLEQTPQVLGVILTGTGGVFASGPDITQIKCYRAEDAKKRSCYAQAIFNRVEGLSKPVIAAVNGRAESEGLELALSCDFRIASENAVFSMPEVCLGIMPGSGGTQRLPRLIGTGRAKELIYTGGQVEAEEAWVLGLVNRVVRTEWLMEEAKKTMRIITGMAPFDIRYAKLAINLGMDTDLKAGLKMEKDLYALCFDTEDKEEGMAAYLENRRPVFRNR